MRGGRCTSLLAVLVLLAATAGAQTFVRWVPPPNVASFYETDTKVVFTKPVSLSSTMGSAVTLPDGASGSESLKFASTAANTGFYADGAFGWIWNVNGGGTQVGVPYATLASFALGKDLPLAWSNSAGIDGIAAANFDVKLYRDAAAALALRNAGTAGVPVPQTFNIYNFCDGAACATGYERVGLGWDTNILEILTESAGTGSSRAIRVGSAGTAGFRISTNGSDKWEVTSTGNMLPYTTDAYGVGTGNKLVNEVYVSRATIGYKTKTLTDASATAFVRIALPQTVGSNFTSGSILWQLHCDNGTTGTYADRAGQTVFTCNNIAGTEACVFDSTAQQVTQAATYSFAAPTFTATGGTDTVDLNVNADCGGVAGPTNMYIHYRLDMLLPQTVTPQ